MQSARQVHKSSGDGRVILVGDCITRLRELPPESVHCVITSPAYWGLRAYLPDDSPDKHFELGREKTWQGYVDDMVTVFREVRRVLRDDGVCFLNLGDSYVTGAGKAHSAGGGAQGEKWAGEATQANRFKQEGIKPKEVAGIPWRVALALSDDGWYLRQDLIWGKGLSFCPDYAGSVMPESVKDRFTRSHEYIFMLTKSERYFFDSEAATEAATYSDEARYDNGKNGYGGRANGGNERGITNRKFSGDGARRKIRSVWAISPKGFPGQHFATMPEALVVPMVQAATSEHGACPLCGAQYVRVKEFEGTDVTPQMRAAGANPDGSYNGVARKEYPDEIQNPSDTKRRVLASMGRRYKYSWVQSCECEPMKPVPAIVLDPFAGAGTTILVAGKLGRSGIGIELNPEYVKLAENRIVDELGLFGGLREKEG